MPSDRANIIKKEMLPAFLSDLDKNKVTKEYWDECKMARNAFTPDDIHKMQMMCRHTDDNLFAAREKFSVSGIPTSGMIKGCRKYGHPFSIGGID